MSAWNYNKKDYEESKIKIPAGDHRVRIGSLTPKVSRNSGNKMYEIILDVSGFSYKIYYYVVFMPDNASFTNRILGQIQESFGVSLQSIDPDKAPAGWVGAVGAARVKLDGEDPKVSYFLSNNKQDDLPPWQEVGKSAAVVTSPATTESQINNLPEDYVADDSADLPFDL